MRAALATCLATSTFAAKDNSDTWTVKVPLGTVTTTQTITDSGIYRVTVGGSGMNVWGYNLPTGAEIRVRIGAPGILPDLTICNNDDTDSGTYFFWDCDAPNGGHEEVTLLPGECWTSTRDCGGGSFPP